MKKIKIIYDVFIKLFISENIGKFLIKYPLKFGHVHE